MAFFKGRDQLVMCLEEAKRPEDKKGIKAEIEVGDFLRKNLLEDTYVIAQPEIGELQPDFLIISPRFGYKLIEVKNMNINYIEKAMSNGLLKTKYKTINPFSQVKTYLEPLKNFIMSNSLNATTDPYRDISYCVIHKGFSEREFKEKFSKQIDKWEKKEINDYFKYHLFYKEMSQSNNLEEVLEKAAKFQNRERYLHPRQLSEIANSIKSSCTNRQDDEYYEKIQEHEEMIAKVSEKLNDISESGTKKKKKPIALMLVGLMLVTAIGFVYLNQNDFFDGERVYLLSGESQSNESNNTLPARNISSQSNTTPVKKINTGDTTLTFSAIDDKNVGEKVDMQARVDKFFHHNQSGVKFLTLNDGTGDLEAVIFKDTKVPYIEKGKTYRFIGEVQYYNGNIELKITEVR
ncbi:NERD domain-containing protein [Serpentinicella sp. ANB-PHB4]|uniref:OB-fold nucleic acid binding domain-containing protein n=1 Tax=Serpentinicella sp. ANB-PHB4 TaxID=3074076 RepID=UPI00285EA896|nr:OB-fold nucleic acid binding domain-containing protein [Serpentinicella sp. ANB-PHB4]MDR5659873.1 NERD domain-containing protein [Serpentinicella sp. ANB-PHB4]